MNIYAQRAGDKLKARLLELEANADKRQSLIDEIDVARSLAIDAVEMYDKVLGADVSPELRANAISITKESLNNVATLLLQAKKLDLMNGASLPAQHVDAIIVKIIRILEQEVPDHVERISHRLQEIRLPSASVVINVD